MLRRKAPQCSPPWPLPGRRQATRIVPQTLIGLLGMWNTAQTEVQAQGPAAAAPSCAGLRGGRAMLYENPHWGFTLTYPSVFALDLRSIPDNADTAQFRTADPQALAIVTALRNGARQSVAELRAEAERDIRENSHGSITYQRSTPDWFVISGLVGNRIYYRRSLLAQRGTVVATLWIEFPRELRPCLEAAVAMMSLSFRAIGP